MPVTISAISSEFLGTFMLVFTVGCVVVSNVSEAWGTTAIACTLMVMIYALAPVSGAHLNPAVSLSLGMLGKAEPHQVVAYVLAQLAAGLVAGVSIASLYGVGVVLGPKPGANWWEAVIVETVYTAMLAFVVLGVTAKRNTPNQFFGLAIGFVIVAAGSAAGSISGAVLNPAVAFGLDVSGYYSAWKVGSESLFPYWTLCYSLYEAAGAIIAALLFFFVRPEEELNVMERIHYAPKLFTKLAAEFIGTFLLVATFGLCVLANSKSTAWATGSALMSLVYALGDVSGGHFNPATTLGSLICRKIDINTVETIAYMLVQVLAAMFASLLYAGLHRGLTFPLEPVAPYDEWAAYIVEAIFTMVVVLAVLATGYTPAIKTDLSRNFYFGLAIGLARTVGMIACRLISGGSLNPAISFAVAFSHKLNNGILYYGFSYSLAELIGGVAAVFVFVVTHAEAYGRKKVLLDGQHEVTA